MTDDTPRRLRITMEGMPDDGGHVRFEDFVLELNRFRSALNKMGRHLGGASLRYRVVALSHDSPAVVELEEVPSPRHPELHEKAENSILRAMKVVDEYDVQPEGVPRGVLSALREFSKPVGKSLHSLTATVNGTSVQVSSSLAPKLEIILAPEVSSFGAVEGQLEQINVHSEHRVIFWIYPEDRTGRVRCVVPKDLEEKAIAALKKPVRVVGELTYKRGAHFPHLVTASDLESIDREDLPRLADLRGRAPHATGSVSTLDFVEALRNEWD